jgi:peptidyl-prolyl cis-trans isomerase D
MFDFIRTHKKIMQILLIILIFPSFVLFGLEGYTSFQNKGETVATIDGLDISKEEWEQAHKIEIDRMRASMPGVDTSMFDTPALKYGVLERLVQTKVLEASARNLKLNISDQRVVNTISDMEALAALKKPDGTLDIEKYKQLLAAQGMSPELFEARMRGDLSVRQVVNGVTQSTVTFPSQVDVAMQAFKQQREVQVAIFSASDYLDQAKPSDDELMAYFNKHADEYKSIETADIEYVVLDLAFIEQTIVVNESELKSYFDQNQAALAGKEERRASHILINAPKGSSEADLTKAKTKASELLSQLRQKPEDFSEFAKKFSQDAGSAPNGGDLDYFAKGAMVKPFEDAAFKLKPGEISDVVESDFGFHIIKLTDIKTASAGNFQQLRPQLEADLKKEQARKKYAELAEQFSNLVYEQSDGFDAVVQKLKLPVQNAKGITREVNGGGKVIWANPNLLKSIFSQESISRKRNTEAVETAANQLVSARITDYRPSTQLSLDNVKQLVVQALLREKSLELAVKDGQSKLSQWRDKPETGSWQVPVTISREQTQQLPANLVDLAMRADDKKLPSVQGVSLGAKGFGIVKINKVVSAPTAAQSPESLDRFTQAWATAENLAYFNLLKDRLKVSVKVPDPLRNDAAK